MLISVLFILVAIFLLYYGAEFSLDASAIIGKKLGMSSLAIGMLLIGFGTSLPEAFVGHIAGMKGSEGIAFGSLIGSNIANMFLVLGICGLITKLQLSNKKLRGQLALHLGLGFLIWYVLTQPFLNLYTGGLLLSLAVLYLFLLFLDMKKSRKEQRSEVDFSRPWLIFGKMLLGFFLLYLGGELLVRGGSELCRDLGVEEYIISSIFIAFGTSFPELVTSLIACKRGHHSELIVGNIIGSNLFNCSLILGSLGIYNFPIQGDFTFEISGLIGGAFFLLLLNLFKKDLYRVGGVVFLVTYLAIIGHWIDFY